MRAIPFLLFFSILASSILAAEETYEDKKMLVIEYISQAQDRARKGC